MFSTNDILIDPAQACDYEQNEKNPKRKHDCPIWNRLSGWAGTDDAACLIMGANAESRYIETPRLAGAIGIKEYALLKNKNLITLSAIMKHYGKGFRIRKTRFYNLADIEAISAQYWPPDTMIRRVDAILIVKKPWYLPKPSWVLDDAKYYDRAECEASRVKVLASIEAKHTYVKKIKHQRSEAEKAKRRIQDKIRKQKERLLTKNGQPEKKRILKPRFKDLQLPDGYAKLHEICKEYGVKTHALHSAIHEGRVEAKKYRSMFIVSIDSFKEYLRLRTERETKKKRIRASRPRKHVEPLIVPDGYIGKVECMKLWPRSYIALYKAIKRGVFKVEKLRGKYFINRDSLMTYIENMGEKQMDLI